MSLAVLTLYEFPRRTGSSVHGTARAECIHEPVLFDLLARLRNKHRTANMGPRSPTPPLLLPPPPQNHVSPRPLVNRVPPNDLRKAVVLPPRHWRCVISSLQVLVPAPRAFKLKGILGRDFVVEGELVIYVTAARSIASRFVPPSHPSARRLFK